MEKITQTAIDAITEKKDILAETVVDRIYERKPELVDFSKRPDRKQYSIQDVKYHLSYLAEAAGSSDSSMFSDYVEWVRVLFKGLGIPDAVLGFTLEQMRSVIAEMLDKSVSTEIFQYLDAGVSRLESAFVEPAPHLDEIGPLGGLAGKYLEALLDGRRHDASRLILEAVENGVPVKAIYLDVFQKAQYEIGRLWQTNRVSVAQEHYCTAAAQLIMSQLYPYIFSTEKAGKRLVAACVGGELHEIGIRMVADFFEMDGWDTYYLGANTPSNTILNTLEEKKADVLGLSATILFNKSTLEDLIKKVRDSEAGESLKILVGGYPFKNSPDLWEKVGADAFAEDAAQAIEKANNLAGG